MTRKLVIVGAGGHGRELADVVDAANEHQACWELLGFLADGEEHPDRAAARRIPILGGVDLLSDLDASYVIGIGDPVGRARVDELATSFGREAAVLVHPQATVGSLVTLEPGCYVAAAAVIMTNVTLGRHSHVNVGASISHDTTVGRWCTVGPGAHIAGWASLADRVEVGIGAVVRDRVTIGEGAVVGAGAAVVGDVAAGVTVVGVPARPVATNLNRLTF